MSDTAMALGAGGPADRKRVLSWAMWDWGTQPFHTVITTFVFAVYITSEHFGSTTSTSLALSLSTGISGLVIALAAPVLGQNADRTGHTVRNLKWYTWALAAISAGLFFVKPDPAFLWFGLILLGLGAIIAEIAGVNYNSLLDQVASPKDVGRISGFGWGMGYLGGIVSLLLLYFLFIQPEVGLFGVTGVESMDIRVSMVLCGIWTAVFTLPTFLVLKDRARETRAPRIGVIQSYRLLGQSIARLWRTSRHTIYFLLASALFRDGLAGVFAFGAVIAAGTFGFKAGDTIIFGAVANVIAGVSTILFGLLDDKIGPKRVILLSLGALVALGLAIFWLHDHGQIVFWTLGMAMTAFVGPAQSASRTFLARLIPAGRSGEVFGLYATTGRVVSFLSPAFFGMAILLGARITGEENTQYWGILGIALVLAAGFILMLGVKGHDEQTMHHA